ncbi:hypothetical protein IB262_33080 [Ensifer sp. ENS02]|uniref:hypothetical protein n=1 Tax=Ensifer sp. ENS02 TaxID=2769290 RepID=UPI0017831B69|nr:hypothetical protein [Ensifer sp. ENS02]MBD9524712.1 hypothetical protein [Ensifer sp. ENS02]
MASAKSFLGVVKSNLREAHQVVDVTHLFSSTARTDQRFGGVLSADCGRLCHSQKSTNCLRVKAIVSSNQNGIVAGATRDVIAMACAATPLKLSPGFDALGTCLPKCGP